MITLTYQADRLLTETFADGKTAAEFVIGKRKLGLIQTVKRVAADTQTELDAYARTLRSAGLAA